jgi:hypothetical protein
VTGEPGVIVLGCRDLEMVDSQTARAFTRWQAFFAQLSTAPNKLDTLYDFTVFPRTRNLGCRIATKKSRTISENHLRMEALVKYLNKLT